MQCPMTTFDCLTCEGACLLQRRKEQNDPFRRGNEMRTCDAEIDRLGLEQVPHCTCAPLPEPASDECPVHVESN